MRFSKAACFPKKYCFFEHLARSLKGSISTVMLLYKTCFPCRNGCIKLHNNLFKYSFMYLRTWRSQNVIGTFVAELQTHTVLPGAEYKAERETTFPCWKPLLHMKKNLPSAWVWKQDTSKFYTGRDLLWA